MQCPLPPFLSPRFEQPSFLRSFLKANGCHIPALSLSSSISHLEFCLVCFSFTISVRVRTFNDNPATTLTADDVEDVDRSHEQMGFIKARALILKLQAKATDEDTTEMSGQNRRAIEEMLVKLNESKLSADISPLVSRHVRSAVEESIPPDADFDGGT